MRIGELAKSVDVNVETIRYYQRIGLLKLPDKPYAGMRSYSDQDLQRGVRTRNGILSTLRALSPRGRRCEGTS
jgi:DNA-binding transcriptional MerR regulator